MEKTIKRSQTNRGDHLVAVFELGEKRGHRSGRFWVQADFRIPHVRAVRRDCCVVAFVEDSVEMDGRSHELYVGRNVLWKMIRVASLRRKNGSALRINLQRD